MLKLTTDTTAGEVPEITRSLDEPAKEGARRMVPNVRLGEERLVCLVIVNGLPDGRKEVIALEDGYRESTEARGPACSET